MGRFSDILQDEGADALRAYLDRIRRLAAAIDPTGAPIRFHEPGRQTNAGPVVVLAAPGVEVWHGYECPDCGVTGDAMGLPGQVALCLACMEVE